MDVLRMGIVGLSWTVTKLNRTFCTKLVSVVKMDVLWVGIVGLS